MPVTLAITDPNLPFPPRIPLAGWAVGLGALLILGYAFFLFRRKS
jgi:hypothetical protein